MPATLYGLVRTVGGLHQLWLAGLSALVFGIALAPLEIQRRIVNAAVAGGNNRLIVLLAVAYLAVGLAEGAIKLGMNIYRGWVAERAVRWLRRAIAAMSAAGSGEAGSGNGGATGKGVEISMTVSEAEPIGSFVGSAVSEPLLQGGILLSVFCYMVYLQPLIALVALGVFVPQFVLVPLMQRALNRRVRARIWFIRKMSTSLVEDDEWSGAGPDRQNRQDRRVDRVFELNMGIFKIKFSLNFLMNVLHYAGIAGILGLGGVLVTTGGTDIGTVVAFAAGLNKIKDPWGDLVDWYRDYRIADARYRLVSSALGKDATG